MTTSLEALLASALLAATSPQAQQPTVEASPDAQTARVVRVDRGPIHTQQRDDGVDYGLWATGRDYKVSFHDGVRFVPYLGRDYPVVRSLRWRTLSVAVGEHELVHHAPRLSHDDFRAEYDLGGVVEAYDVLPGGLEQTFVLAERADAVGDLVIRGRAGGNVTAHDRPDGAHRELLFRDEAGNALVGYGAATAIDADGRRRAMTTALVDGTIVLRLDGDWLERATYPVVVDPLFTPKTVWLWNSTGLGAVDVLADDIGPVTERGLYYATVRYAASGDGDLRLLQCNQYGNNPAIVFDDVQAAWSTVEPSLGISYSAQAILCAFTRDFTSSGNRRIRFHRHDHDDPAFSNAVFQYNPVDNRSRWRPRVGSDFDPGSPTSLLTVCQTESTGPFAPVNNSEIGGIVLSLAVTAALYDDFPIAVGVAQDLERPSVANVASGGHSWTVAWQRYQNFVINSTWDVEAARVTDDGTVTDRSVVAGGVTGSHEMAPRIAGEDERFNVFWTESTIAESSSKPTGENGHRIRSVRLDHTPTGFVTPWPVRLLNSNGDPRAEIAGAAFDRRSQGHWCMAIRSNVTQSVYLRVYGHRGLQVDGLIAEQAPSGGSSAAGGVTFRQQASLFWFAYGLDDPGSGSQARLSGWVMPSYSGGGTGPAGCSTATISWYGESRVGADLCGIALENAPAGALTAISIGSSYAQLQLFGIPGVRDGCFLHVQLSGPVYLGMLGPQVGSSATFALPLPESLAPLATTTLYFQAIVFDPATGEFESSSAYQRNIGWY